MKKPTTIQELLDFVNPTEDQKLFLNYSGSDPVCLGAQAFMLAELIAKYFNNGETENYWWGWYKQGSGFIDSDCNSWCSDAYLSSRLLFHKEQDFLYATKTFPEVYKTLMEV